MSGQEFFEAKVRRIWPMTWCGTCLITVSRALHELPSADARLTLIGDLQHYLERQRSEIERRRRGRAKHKIIPTKSGESLFEPY